MMFLQISTKSRTPTDRDSARYRFTFQQLPQQFLGPNHIGMISVWQLMLVRIRLVGLEDWSLMFCQNVSDIGFGPWDAIHIECLSVCNTIIHTILRQNNDVCSCQDGCHVFRILYTAEGRSDNVQEVLVPNVPCTGALHLREEFTFKNMIVRVVARMASRPLIELCRRVASPHGCVFFLSNCCRNDKASCDMCTAYTM